MTFILNKIFKPLTLLSGLLVLPLLSYPALAQTYQIQDFSDDYDAVIEEIEGKEYGYEANSIVKIIDKKTHKTLINQPASIDIEYELSNSEDYQLGEKISANIVSIPYGEHSVLIYDDFNFDGQKDLAIKDGRHGCYGGPSYQVYLKNDDKFVLSEGFTDLAQGYCGFFGVNKDSQTLYTMTKSGAGWHQYSKYKVIDNKPVAVHVLVEEYNPKQLISITESTRVNGEMVEDSYEVLPEYDNESHDGTLPFIYKLDLDNGKKMVLNNTYNEDGDQLYYAFADKDDRIELYYDGLFVYDKSKQTLSFLNKPVVYQINKQGITVRQSNKSVLLKSVPQSEQGSLENLAQFNRAC
ncbi:XAC2610-related protein [Psychrobacter sp. AOP42-A1-21]|uniref:XAC2610-related protein n=1 Tax=Psychrobacter sp. AOP42-A1-21 TaxID=3457675 RepID=UPI003FE41D11